MTRNHEVHRRQLDSDVESSHAKNNPLYVKEVLPFSKYEQLDLDEEPRVSMEKPEVFSVETRYPQGIPLDSNEESRFPEKSPIASEEFRVPEENFLNSRKIKT